MRKILIQLWQQCNHKCDFCFQNGHFTDDDKIQNVQNAINILSASKMVDVETINIMGGELFDFQWSDSLRLKMKEFFAMVRYLMNNGKLRNIYLMTNFIYNTSQLDEVLSWLYDIRDKVSFCTSWDYTGRFRNNKDKDLFFKNIEKYKNLGYEIFCSITLTEALMNAVVNEGYTGLIDLDQIFDKRISFHTPHGELFSDEKFDLQHFYPTRELFLQFVMKMMKDESFNVEKFLNSRYYPDTYFYIKDGEFVEVHNSTLSIGSYSDSAKTMLNDFTMLKESLHV